MKILHVIPYYLPAIAFGGPLTVCRKLAEDAAQRGHQVTVLTTDVASRTERVSVLTDMIGGVKVVRARNLSQRLVAGNLYTPFRAKQIMSELVRHADIVHVHEFFNWLSYRGAVEAMRFARPVLLSGHGSLSISEERGRTLTKRLWLKLLGDRAIAACAMIQVASEYEARSCIAAGVPPARIRVIPQGVAAPPRGGSAKRFRERFEVGSRPIVLFVGRLLAGKGVDLLLQAAHRLESHPLSPLFVLVGPPENRPDLEQVGVRGSNVLLTGPLTGVDLDDAYRAASVFVLPSFAEGMPVTALDAFAFGVPCVLSHACNLPEVEESGAGVLVAPDVDSLTEGLLRMFALSQQWPEMSQRALVLAASRFDIARIHDQYLSLYEELQQRTGIRHDQLG